jgi:hypothetical protein
MYMGIRFVVFVFMCVFIRTLAISDWACFCSYYLDCFSEVLKELLLIVLSLR